MTRPFSIFLTTFCATTCYLWLSLISSVEPQISRQWWYLTQDPPRASLRGREGAWDELRIIHEARGEWGRALTCALRAWETNPDRGYLQVRLRDLMAFTESGPILSHRHGQPCRLSLMILKDGKLGIKVELSQ